MKCFDVKMENSKAGRIWGILSLIDSVVSQQLFHEAKINAEMVFWGHSCRRDCGEFQWKSSRIVKNLIFKTQGTKKRCLLFILSKKLKRNLMFHCQDAHRPWFLVPWSVLCCSPESILLLWLELTCWERGSLVSQWSSWWGWARRTQTQELFYKWVSDRDPSVTNRRHIKQASRKNGLMPVWWPLQWPYA